MLSVFAGNKAMRAVAGRTQDNIEMSRCSASFPGELVQVREGVCVSVCVFRALKFRFREALIKMYLN